MSGPLGASLSVNRRNSGNSVPAPSLALGDRFAWGDVQCRANSVVGRVALDIAEIRKDLRLVLVEGLDCDFSSTQSTIG